jgi:hypothetical protein
VRIYNDSFLHRIATFTGASDNECKVQTSITPFQIKFFNGRISFLTVKKGLFSAVYGMKNGYQLVAVKYKE